MNHTILNYVRKTSGLLLMLAAFAGMTGGCASEAPQAAETSAAAVTETAAAQMEPETTVETTESEQVHTIETAYIPFRISDSFMQDISHQEITEGDIAMEIFCMKTADTPMELFRIYFNDRDSGTMIGNLNIGEKMIPVTVIVSEYSAEAFQDEEQMNRYYFVMDALSEVLLSVRSHSAFVYENDPVVEKNDIKVSYWTFSLPEGIDWEESRENGNYFISFYGTVNGEKVDLYAVAVSEDTLATVLGTYAADGAAKPISIKSYDLPDTADWEEADAAQLYTWKDTINDVIQVITSSEGFSAEIPEA